MIIKATTILLLIFQSTFLFSQSYINEIFSDYNGFWRSSSLVTPNNSHNLLGFRIGTEFYSTGVNDALLTANNVVFNPQQFVSLPLKSGISAQYIGVGSEYGGHDNVSPVPVTNEPSKYLTDGLSGLDLGTAIFNSSGSITYGIDSLILSAIGDGIPDLLVTQMGDPSSSISSLDKFKFIDIHGNIVGVEKTIAFSNVPSVGIAKWKFYDATTLSYQSGLYGTRAMRFISFDLSDLGINASNYNSIVAFVHTLSGTSDQAFVAYNKKTISGLPVEMVSFQATSENRKVLLNWETASERNNNFFLIEKTMDGKNWETVGKVTGAGNSAVSKEYSIYDLYPNTGISYYRISQTDYDGKTTVYPHVVTVSMSEQSFEGVFPNPTNSTLTIMHHAIKAENQTLFSIVGTSGQNVSQNVAMINQFDGTMLIDVRQLPAGMYFLTVGNSNYSFVVTAQ